jgi:hypothetical protein
VHFKNALFPILATLFPSVTDAREGHCAKALPPTLVTLSGIATADSDVQYWNAPFPILATLFPSVTDMREEQCANA